MQNKKGSALIITLFITMIISIIAIYLLDKIVPISRNVKGIENGNVAYYSANSGIEEALLAMTGADPSFESGADNHGTTSTGYAFQITATGKVMPAPGEGNSEYDSDWNKIGLGEPVQLVIKDGITWSNVNFYFKIPDLNKDGTAHTLSGMTNSGVVNWILSGKDLSGTGISLYASGEMNMIPGGVANSGTINLGGLNGFDLNGSIIKFKDFYANQLSGCSSKCTLKLSVITPLLLSSPANIYAPYLEYKIDWGTVAVPFQNTKIESDGYSYGFKKHIRRDVQQVTTNEGLDFTVFQ